MSWMSSRISFALLRSAVVCLRGYRTLRRIQRDIKNEIVYYFFFLSSGADFKMSNFIFFNFMTFVFLLFLYKNIMLERSLGFFLQSNIKVVEK